MNAAGKILVKIAKALGFNPRACRNSFLKDVVLESEKTMTIQARRRFPKQVACHRGVLWITQEGSCKDIILQRGQRVTLRGRGKILIHALSSASFLMRDVRQPA